MNTDRLTLAHGDSVEVFQVKAVPTRKAKGEGYYWWYGANSVKRTQGAIAGKVLVGEYTLYSVNKDLLTRGQYEQGQREGQWRYWYTNGALRKEEKWKKGRREGSFKDYGMTGQVVREGTYRRDFLEGVVRAYDQQGNVTKSRYRKGELRLPKERMKTEEKKDSKLRRDFKDLGQRLKAIGKQENKAERKAKGNRGSEKRGSAETRMKQPVPKHAEIEQ